MSEQALDLKRSVQIIRRHSLTVAIVAFLGLAAGGSYGFIQPPKLASTALVRIVTPLSPNSANNTATMVVVATSDPVFSLALPNLPEDVTSKTLNEDVQARSQTPGIISITAEARTAPRAEAIANAMARAFVKYLGSPNSLSGGTVQALVQNPASAATGRPLAVRIVLFGAIGLLGGAVLGSIAVLAIRRRDRRLYSRDEIADSIGIPVLASIPVGHPSDAAGWVYLLTEYEPSAVDAWRLRGALRYLGLGSDGADDMGQGEGMSLTVLSLRNDVGALALGPQLAVFAASLGIRTQLMIGPQQVPNVTATLRTACSGMVTVKSKWSRLLQVAVRDQDNIRDQANVALTVLVSVVDEQAPQIASRRHTNATVLGVSAGAATAEELARVAVSAADSGRQIAGILVADSDPADTTTGRIPHPTRMTVRRTPTHLTGIPTETGQWTTQNKR